MPSSSEITSYFRVCSCLVDLLPGLLQSLLTLNLPPKKLKQTIKRNQNIKLNPSQKSLVESGSVPDYSKFDLILLFTFLRHGCPKIDKPSHGWDSPPKAGTEITIGDDLERIQKLKYVIYSHLKICAFPPTKFKRIWYELRQVIIRLDKEVNGGERYINAFTALEKERIEEDNRNQLIQTLVEWKETDDAIEKKPNVDVDMDTKRSFRQLQRDMCGATEDHHTMKGIFARESDKTSMIYRMKIMEDSILELKQEQKVQDVLYVKEVSKVNEFVLSNLRQSTDTTLEQYRKQISSLFVETNGAKASRTIFNEEGAVFLVGQPGDGKTTLGLYLLNISYPHEVEPPIKLILDSPEQFSQTVDLDMKYVVFIDDLFGEVSKHQSRVEEWTKLLDLMMWLVQSQRMKLILSSRESIFQECESLPEIKKHIKQKHVLKLTDRRYKLSISEKREILDKHCVVLNRSLNEKEKSVIIKSTPSMFGFPQCVKYFLSSKNNGKSFIMSRQSMFEEIDSMYFSENIKYMALALVFFSEKQLSFDGRDNIANVGMQFSLLFGKADVSTKYIEAALKSMDRSFVKFTKKTKSFRFSHETIAEALLQSLSKRYPKETISYCPLSYIDTFAMCRDEEYHEIHRIIKDKDAFVYFPVSFQSLIKERIENELKTAKKAHFEKVASMPIWKIDDVGMFRNLFFVRDENYSTLLLHAAKVSNSDLIEKILEAIPLYNEDMSSDIEAGLLETCRKGNKRAFYSLVPWNQTMSAEIALAAVEGGDVDILQRILKDFNVTLKNADGDNLLMIAAKRGHFNCVKMICNFAPTLLPDNNDQTGTVLHAAVLGQNIEVLDWLIKRIVRDMSQEDAEYLLGKRNNKGHTILHTAAMEQNDEIALTLLKSFSADFISIPDNKGDTVWHLAARSGKTEIVKYVIANIPTIITLNDNAGGTALHHAAAGGSVQVFNELVQAGLSPTSATKNGVTVLHKAAENSRFELVRYVIKHVSDLVTMVDSAGRTALHAAAAGGNIDLFNELVNSGLSPETTTKDGSTVLHIAAVHAHEDLVTFLLRNCPSIIPVTNSVGETALHYAAAGGNIDVYEYLVKKGLNQQLRTKEGNTVLHMAACNGKLDFVRYIINSTTDLVSSVTDSGKTALHNAAASGDVDVFNELIQAGLSSRATTKHGTTVLHIAAYSGKSDLVKWITNNIPDIVPLPDKYGWTALHFAAVGGNFEVFLELEQSEIPMESVTDDGSSILHIAAFSGNLELVRYVINSAPEIPHLVNKAGESALLFAALGGSVYVFHELMQAGLSADVSTRTGINVLHIAAFNGKLDMVKYIVQNVNDIVHETDSSKWNAAHYASVAGHTNIVKELLKAGLSAYSKTIDGSTILHQAAYSGKVGLVKYITRNISDLMQIHDVNSLTPLHSAAVRGNIDVFNELVIAGLPPQNTTKDGSTVLHIAAYNGKLELVRYIKTNIPNIISSSDEYLWTAIHSAAAGGDINVFVELLQVGLSPRSTTDHGLSVLHIAAFSKHTNLVKYIINNVADVLGLLDEAGNSAIHFAAAGGSIEVIQNLVSAGLSANTFPHDGSTILHFAAENCQEDMTRYIIKTFSEIVPFNDKFGRTALHAAAMGGNVDLFQELVLSNLSPQMNTDIGNTVLHIAAEHGRADLVKHIINNVSGIIPLTDDIGKNALHYAAAGGSVGAFASLLQTGLSPQPFPNDGRTVLHVAAMNMYEDLVIYIIDNIPEIVMLCDDSDWTALHYATAGGGIKVFRKLIDAGLSPKSLTDDGNTVLHKAAFCGQVELVKYIVENFQDILPLTDNSKWTALHSAAAGGQVDVFSELIKAGLSAKTKSSGGSTALHIAAYNGKLDIVKFIENNITDAMNAIDESGKSALHYAAAGGDLKVFNELIHAGVSPQSTTYDGSTILHIAAYNSRVDVVKYVIENFPNIISLTDGSHWTALHCASVTGNIKVFEELINAGLLASSITNLGKTCLHIAASNKNLELVRFILKRKDDHTNILSITDDSGGTVLHSAAAGGSVSVFMDIVEAGLSPSKKRKDGSTVLHVAAYNNKLDLVKHIINTEKGIVEINNEAGGTALHSAAGGGTIEVFNELVNAGILPTVATKLGKTTLHEAAYNGNLNLIRHIVLEFPELIPLMDESKRTALHYTAAGGSVDVYRELVKAGLSQKARAKGGRTVLHIAAYNGRVDLIAYISDTLPEIVELTDDTGKTALHHTATGGSVDAFSELTEIGLSPRATTNDDSTVLHIAAYNGKIELVNHIATSVTAILHLTDESGWTALHFAAAGGNVEVYDELVKAGLSARDKTYVGSTVLHLAAANGRLKLVNHILKTNQKFIYAIDNKGRTALHSAAGESGKPDVFDLLVRGGLSVLTKDEGERTSLDLARASNQPLYRHIISTYPEFKGMLPDLPRPQRGGRDSTAPTENANRKSKTCVVQ